MTHPKAGGLVTHLAMLLNVLLVSTSFPVGAAITHALEPAVLNCVRFALAAAVFAALLTLRGEWRRPRARDGLRYLLLAGALALRFGRGDLIFLAGCVSLAAFAPLTRRLDVGENLVSQTFWTLVVGTAMLALIAGSDLAHTPDTASELGMVRTRRWRSACRHFRLRRRRQLQRQRRQDRDPGTDQDHR